MTRRFLAPLAAVLLAACGASGAGSSADAISTSAVDPGNAGGNKLLTVMTRNLYVGGDLFLPFVSEDPLAAAALVFNDILQSDPGDRMFAIADEIRAARADLVGLEEAYHFVVTPIGMTTPVLMDIDFLGWLTQALDAAAEDGDPLYRLVAAQPQTTLTLPLPALGVQVTMIDHDAILARAGVSVGSSDGGSFQAEVVTSLAGHEIHQTRGWVSIEARHQGVPFTFVATHLEVKQPFGPLQSFQAMELLARFGTSEPVILVGDTNSDPTDPPYQLNGQTIPTPYQILASAFRDAASGVGDTCCFDADLRTGSLTERVDLVFLRGALTPLDAYRTGTDPLSPLGDRWPSDHAGVVATIRLENPRFYALKP